MSGSGLFTVDMRIDISYAKNKFGEMERKAGLVMAHAANRAASAGKTLLKKETSEKYLVRQKDIEGLVKVTKAYAGRPYAKIIYKDSHRNLAHWPLKSRNLSPYNKVIQFDYDGKPNVKVYKAAVMRGQGKQELGGDRKPFIQIARRSGNIALFRRKDGSTNKIEGVSGPAFTQVIQNPDTMRKFNEEIKGVFWERTAHEIDRVLGK